MQFYRALKMQSISEGRYSIVPIRMEDRYEIMNWRNDQMYHLRQVKPLTRENQDTYFDTVISDLFEKKEPSQILFSYLEDDKCIGYGGLVHINWIDKNAEISFIMDTSLEKEHFEFHWTNYLTLLEKVAWEDLNLHKIYTYAFDLRPRLYVALEKAGFGLDSVLKEHCCFENKFIDVKIHSKLNNEPKIRKVNTFDLQKTYSWINDPNIRMYSFNKDSVTLQDHAVWFFNTLENPGREYYILEVNGVAAGSIRFDFDNEQLAKINYLLDPNFTGKGLGTYLLEEGVNFLKINRPLVKKVYGWVLPDNIASIKIFEKLDYKKAVKESSEFKFEKTLK
ncbi:Protein N-acetyltransferase, RimJ/RimL family [Salinimicrobium catena]|uniref:Protein N-acetyltransferase, RimJ/RimL family n=1 Tax=Salinimicrobium catena TaxID=390640 RepID=A0A1H5PDW8_9FLAO|nr:GNAT family N-acetyltransferase [Salinimicrobium catena]SDL80987.1 Protein N-acetyltransferase, RimJ/RimL family [Salinimicrobium catena]SEF12103.1 Protein N-acetyltransferase, RimJ/RimL family [Salinimicrobium catena]